MSVAPSNAKTVQSDDSRIVRYHETVDEQGGLRPLVWRIIDEDAHEAIPACEFSGSLENDPRRKKHGCSEPPPLPKKAVHGTSPLPEVPGEVASRMTFGIDVEQGLDGWAGLPKKTAAMPRSKAIGDLGIYDPERRPMDKTQQKTLEAGSADAAPSVAAESGVAICDARVFRPAGISCAEQGESSREFVVVELDGPEAKASLQRLLEAWPLLPQNVREAVDAIVSGYAARDRISSAL